MKILVTGSSGFIGQNLVSHFEQNGHRLLGVDRKAPISVTPSGGFVECDILDVAKFSPCVADFRPEVIIHLAARTSLKEVPPSSDRYADNTVGTQNVIDAARAAGVVRRIVFTSTKYVHRGDYPAHDRDYNPTTSYGRSKAEMEQMVWEQDGGCAEWCIARPTTVWGPGMGAHYQRFLNMVRKGRYVHIGARKIRKHMAFVGNIVFQFRKLAEAPADFIHRKVFYLADYEPMIIREWVETLRLALDASPIKTIPLPIAKLAATIGDAIVKCGYRKFPFTAFRLRNLTIDDLCDVSLTEKVCGGLPHTTEAAAKATAKWYLALSTNS
jgi:GlcNAc-P-P-Und epimerase